MKGSSGMTIVLRGPREHLSDHNKATTSSSRRDVTKRKSTKEDLVENKVSL